jgi:hypothetical protein
LARLASADLREKQFAGWPGTGKGVLQTLRSAVSAPGGKRLFDHFAQRQYWIFPRFSPINSDFLLAQRGKRVLYTP